MLARKAKRRKQDESTLSTNTITLDSSTSANSAEVPKLVYMDEGEFRVWAKGQSPENTEALAHILRGLCDLLNHRHNTSMTQSILLEFLRRMSIHGVPFCYIVDPGIYCSSFLAREEFRGKYPATININQFFQDLSDLEYGLRASIWAFHTIQMGKLSSTSPLVQNRLCLHFLRYQLSMASRRLNYRAVVNQLATSELLRMTTETIEKRIRGWGELVYQKQMQIYYDSPIAFFMALQSTLAMEHDSSFKLGDRLVMLATMQSMIYTTIGVKNTILMQLSEVLIAALLCGELKHVLAILELEHKIHRYNKKYDNIIVWNAYKLIAEYEEWRGRTAFGGMILNTAQSLYEVAESMPAYGTLFLETACQIWAKQGRCEDRIAEAVSKILKKCPQLLGRISNFLRSIDFDHEVDVAIEEVCGAESSGLHPSDAAWLDYCQPRIERPEKYGQRTVILARCVSVLFEYLDYGSNRADTRAWMLLHTVVQLVDPSLLIPIWRERYDWWPRFHTETLPSEAEFRRTELLAALAATPTV